MNREERQNIGVSKWLDSPIGGTLVYPPAFGKTYVGIKVLNRINTNNAIVILPNEITLKQWESVLENTSITYTTLRRFIKNRRKFQEYYETIIVDELHLFDNNEGIAIIDKKLLTYSKILALTATYPSNNLSIFNARCPKLDYISENEAVKNNWIASFKEYNIGIELSETHRSEYDNYTKYMSRVLEKFNNNLNNILYCVTGFYHKPSNKFITPFEFRKKYAAKKGWSEYLTLTNRREQFLDEAWNPNVLREECDKFKCYMDARNKIINEAQYKVDVVSQIIKRFYQHNKIISFSQSTVFANKLYSNLVFDLDEKIVKYHSNIQSEFRINSKTGDYYRYGKTSKNAGNKKPFGKTFIKNESIEKIRSGKAKVISTAKALDAGFNVNDLNIAIISSGSINPIQQTQRKGRVYRLDIYNKEKNVLIFNVYFKNTRDEAKLKERQATNTKEVAIVELEDVLQIKIT